MLLHHHSFPKERRLLKQGEFLETTSRGKRIFSKNLIFFVNPNNFGYLRIGITVSRKFGNAAARNRVKRLIRESFRLIYSIFNNSVDLVVIVKNNADIEDLYQCKDEFKSAFRKIFKNNHFVFWNDHEFNHFRN